jgi:hypothetical protein
MVAARAEESSGFDDYWEAVDRILEGGLWTADVYETEAEFCREVLKTDVRTAKRMARVARIATEKEIERYLPTLLDEVVDVLELKAGPIEGKLPVALDRVKIPKNAGGKKRMVSLDDASVADVRAYKRELLRASGKARAPASPAAAKLREAVTTIASLRDVEVVVSDAKARFAGVPLAAINTFGRALAHVTLPSPGAPAKKKAAKKKRRPTR